MKEVCEKYHLGPEDELNKSELTGVESSEENLRMQKSSSLSPEKTLMHLSKYSLLYCWVHKVLRQKYGKTFTKSKGKLLKKDVLKKAASSSWNKIFFQLVGKTKVKEHNLHEVSCISSI